MNAAPLLASPAPTTTVRPPPAALSIALAYARRGWAVFPLAPANSTRNGKTPATANGFKDATVDPEKIAAAFGSTPGAGVGIATGPARWLVLDIDMKAGKDGRVTLASLEVRRGKLPATLRQHTPSGGEHLIYALPEGVQVRSGVNVLGPGVDVRAADAYICAAPTRVIDNEGNAGTYGWIGGDPLGDAEVTIAEAPAWLIEEVTTRRQPTAKPVKTLPRAPPDALADLRDALSYLVDHGGVDPTAYDEWIAVGHALKTAGEGAFALWCEFSSRDQRFDATEAAARWCTFRPSRTEFRTLFRRAQDAGWINPRRRRAALPVPVSHAARDGSSANDHIDADADADADDQPDDPHPLTLFLDLAEEPQAPRWVVPWFMSEGVAVIAGAHGAGKTTVLAPLAMIVAGLHRPGDPLAPRHWRHVVYVAEDVEQLRRILRGATRHAGVDTARLCERFHVVPARRLPPEEVAAAGPIYRERFTRDVDGVELLPLVVIDTKNATVSTNDENDNAEASRMVALFKQQFAGLPLWLVGHVAKSLVSRRDVPALSARGAGAIEADAHLTMFLVVEDDGRRFLVLGKRRFEPRWTELEVQAGIADATLLDEFGEPQTVTLRWGWPAPPLLSRAEAREEAREAEADQAEKAMRHAVLEAVELAEKAKLPLNREGVKAKVSGRRQAVIACIDALMAEGWLQAVSVPSTQRRHPRQTEFLIRLNDAERRDVIAGRPLPAARTEVPASFRKAISSIPEPERMSGSPEGG